MIKKKAIRRPARVAEVQDVPQMRKFRMHSKLLFDVILRQAGSLSKAVLEAVMNSVDAKAKQCVISVTEDKVIIDDNGVGFKSQTEIENWFEEFGRPHDENEQKVYGRFRMGRGQLFAYGVNVWKTNRFQMSVDVKHNGLDYELRALKPSAPGCHIEMTLYERLLPSDIHQIVQTLKVWCKYAPIDIVLNGTKINCRPEKESWSYEIDEAYIRLDDSAQMRIYNQGVLVLEFPKNRFGSGGAIVTKKELEVNFARNDIQSSCPVWRKIRPMVDTWAAQRISKKRSLDDSQRYNLRLRWVRGESQAKELHLAALFTAVTGRHYTLGQVGDYDFNFRLTFAPKGDVCGDTIHRQKIAFVLSTTILDDMGFADGGEFARWAKTQHICGQRIWSRPRELVSFSKLVEGLNTTFTLLDDKELTPKEQLWMRVLRDASYHASRQLPADAIENFTNRKFVLGESTMAEGWTDAESFVAISRNYMRDLKFDVSSFTKLGGLTLHELCHQNPDFSEHDHDQTFYEKFHDYSEKFVSSFVDRCVNRFPAIFEQERRRLSKEQLKTLDKVTKIQRIDDAIHC